MRVNAFKRTLEEFSRQARRGNISADRTEGEALARSADQLLRQLLDEGVLRKSILSEDTISSAPSGACPCCGK
jgi:hypothetical protein